MCLKRSFFLSSLVTLILVSPATNQSGDNARRTCEEAVGVELLRDREDVDPCPYVKEVAKKVRAEWFLLVPESAREPLRKSGSISIRFAILANGKVGGMQMVKSSGDKSMDRAAWGGIFNSQPFPQLPKGIKHGFLPLQFNFTYNP